MNTETDPAKSVQFNEAEIWQRVCRNRAYRAACVQLESGLISRNDFERVWKDEENRLFADGEERRQQEIVRAYMVSNPDHVAEMMRIIAMELYAHDAAAGVSQETPNQIADHVGATEEEVLKRIAYYKAHPYRPSTYIPSTVKLPT